MCCTLTLLLLFLLDLTLAGIAAGILLVPALTLLFCPAFNPAAPVVGFLPVLGETLSAGADGHATDWPSSAGHVVK